MTLGLRRLAAPVAALLLPVVLASCDTDAQFAPSLTRVVGLQADGRALRILTGAPCADVTRIVLVFSADSREENPRAVMAADAPTTVEQLSVDAQAVAASFEATEALPADFDWRDYDEMSLVLDGPDGSVGVATSDLEAVRSEGDQRAGDGTAYVRGEGWLTPQEVAEGDGTSFLGACTPDPEPGSTG